MEDLISVQILPNGDHPQIFRQLLSDHSLQDIWIVERPVDDHYTVRKLWKIYP